jgi:hypothetical protein
MFLISFKRMPRKTAIELKTNQGKYFSVCPYVCMYVCIPKEVYAQESVIFNLFNFSGQESAISFMNKATFICTMQWRGLQELF